MQSKTIISTILQLGSILGLMCLTLMSVEIRWSEADVALAYSIPMLGVVGLVCLFITRNAWRWTWIDYIAGGWIAYWILRIWIGGEYPCANAFLQTTWMILLYGVLRLVFTGCDRKLLYLIALLVLVFGAIESIWGFWQIVTGTSRHGIFLLTGNFLNPGPYSAYPMMGAISGFCLINGPSRPPLKGGETENGNEKRKEYLKRIVEGLTLVCLMVMPATWSRAAWVGVGTVALWIFRDRYWKWRWYVWGGLLALAIIVFFAKQGSAEGRLIIWTAALTSWWQEPLWGVGFGGFNHACAEGIASLYQQDPMMFSGFQSAGVAEISYNALLQILTEQGLVGVTLCIALITLVLVRANRLCQPLMYGLVAMLLFSFFSYPLEMLPYRILLTVIVAAIASAREETEVDRKAHWWKAVPLCILTIGICLPLRSETERRKESDEGFRLISSMKDPFFLKDYWELLPDERDNSAFLFEMAKLLQSQGRYRDSNAILRQGILVSRDPMFYVLLGNNYKSMGFPDRADSAYVKAFQILPNRMYPLYQRMLLKQELGNQQLSSALAKQIVEMRPKIKSPATDEMQEKATEVLAVIGREGDNQP